MKLNLFGLALMTSLFAFEAFGHGEDKLGPNKGFIRMPGAFHTELTPVSESEVAVRLLDINFKNPTVKNSSVRMIVSINPSIEITCGAQNSEFFSCALPKGFGLKSPGRIVIKSVRENQKGHDAVYELPLKIQSNNGSHTGHH